MFSSRWLVMLPAVCFISFLTPVAAVDSPPETSLYSVRFADDSQATLRLLTETIKVSTAYGNLEFPIADVRRIDLGIRDFKAVDGLPRRSMNLRKS